MNAIDWLVTRWQADGLCNFDLEVLFALTEAECLAIVALLWWEVGRTVERTIRQTGCFFDLVIAG